MNLHLLRKDGWIMSSLIEILFALVFIILFAIICWISGYACTFILPKHDEEEFIDDYQDEDYYDADLDYDFDFDMGDLL